MKQLIKKVKQISILILTLSLLSGCENNDGDYPQITAGYTYTLNPATGTVTFINISTNSQKYEWDFGDGETSTEINPIKTFAPGTYTVIVKAMNLAGGSETFESVITITKPTIPCSGEAAESWSAASLNITFKTEPVAGSIVSDGTSFAWVSNPSYDNALNSSCKVGKVSNLGVNPWDNVQIPLDAKLDLSTNGGLKMKVFSSVPGFKVTLKLEDKTNSAINTQVEVATTKTSEWEELTFDFPATETNKYDKIVLIFDLATKNTNTYYFDDLKLFTRTGGTGGACATEDTETNSAAGLNITFKTDITSKITNDNATFSWVSNPSASGINTSCKVGKVTKNGVNPWDNNQIDLASKLDFTTNGGFKIKVYSAVPGFKVLLKLEEIGNSSNNKEIELTTTKTNEWEELTYSFSTSDTNKFNKIVLIFDLASKNTNTYYFDDLKLFDRTTTGGGGSTGGGSTGTYNLSLPIDFETTGFGANWTWNVFENGSNQPLEFIANPSASGINTSAKVAKITALKAGAPWVGTETAHGQMGINWNLSSSNSVIKIMVYKTVISDVGIKLVNAAGGAQAEIRVANTKINQWEELTFDFRSRIGNGLDGSSNIDQIVVFPDFKDPRAADNVVYFDNITFNAN